MAVVDMHHPFSFTSNSTLKRHSNLSEVKISKRDHSQPHLFNWKNFNPILFPIHDQCDPPFLRFLAEHDENICQRGIEHKPFSPHG